MVCCSFKIALWVLIAASFTSFVEADQNNLKILRSDFYSEGSIAFVLGNFSPKPTAKYAVSELDDNGNELLKRTYLVYDFKVTEVIRGLSCTSFVLRGNNGQVTKLNAKKISKVIKVCREWNHDNAVPAFGGEERIIAIRYSDLSPKSFILMDVLESNKSNSDMLRNRKEMREEIE